MLRISIFLVTLCGTCIAQEQLSVSEYVWRNLLQAERDSVQRQFIVIPIPLTSFGLIIDNQGADESVAGTNAGSSLGGGVANAAYIDHALKSGNYSARNQLGAILLGAALGASLDTPGQSKFHFRYAVKHQDGEITYHDIIQGDSFRHPSGICVSVPSAQKISQAICTETVDSFRSKYISALHEVSTTAPEPALLPETTDRSVECAVKNLPKFKTSYKKCRIISGIPNE